MERTMVYAALSLLALASCVAAPEDISGESAHAAPGSVENGLTVLEEAPDRLVAIYRDEDRSLLFEKRVDGETKELLIRDGEGHRAVHFRSDHTRYEVSMADEALVIKGVHGDANEAEVTGDPAAAGQVDSELLQRAFDALQQAGVDLGGWQPAPPPGAQALSTSYFCGTATLCAFAVLICQDRQCGDAGCPVSSTTYPCGVCVGWPTGFFPPVEEPHFPAYCH